MKSKGLYTIEGDFHIILEKYPSEVDKLLAVKLNTKPTSDWSIPVPREDGSVLWTSIFVYIDPVNKKEVEIIDDYYVDLARRIYEVSKTNENDEELKKEITDLINFAKIEDETVVPVPYKKKQKRYEESIEDLVMYRYLWRTNKKALLKQENLERMTDGKRKYIRSINEIIKRVNRKIIRGYPELAVEVPALRNPNSISIPLDNWNIEDKISLIIDAFSYSIEELRKMYNDDEGKISNESLIVIMRQVLNYNKKYQ